MNIIGEQKRRRRSRGWPVWSDAVAGVSTAALLVPQAMAYAMLAGLPPEFGLRTSMLPLLVFAAVGGAATVAVGPTALSAALFGAGVIPLTQRGLDLSEAVFLLAAAVGVIQLLIAALRGGVLVNFLSAPVVNGFATAAGVTILVGQCFPLLGLEPAPAGTSLYVRIHLLLHSASQADLLSVLTGGVVLAIVSTGPRYLPRMPWPALALLTAIGAAVRFGLPIDRVGDIAAGGPGFTWAMGRAGDVGVALGMALPVVLIGFLELLTVQQRFDPRRTGAEARTTRAFAALGSANVASAVSGGFVAGAGLSRSAFFVQSGARTRWANVFTAAGVLGLVSVASPVLALMPVSALAALIISAAWSLVDLRYPRWLWNVRRGDAVLWGATAAMTLVFGVQAGILGGIGASLLWFVVRTTHPHTAILGRLPGTSDYRNLRNHPDAETFPGVLILRMDAQFYFGNVSFLRDRLESELSRAKAPVHTVVIEAASMNQLDATAAAALLDLALELKGRGITLSFANVKRPVFDVMERAGIVEAVGAEQFYLNVDAAVRAACRARGCAGTEESSKPEGKDQR